MSAYDALLEDLAGAILDGTPIDWAEIQSRAAEADPALIAQLRTLAALTAASGTAETAESRGHEHWAHLQVLECIGRGSAGEVYRAWDTRLDREVALKLLPLDSAPASRRSSIIEEGRLLARVRHPNVVTIYGAERIEGRIGLWMELVKGRTLEEAVRQGQVFSAAEVIRIGLELCQAISAVHSAGLLHRDIKAQNVMAADDGRVVLMDFGTGLEKTAGSDRVAGTPLYLAPELFSGHSATIQSDIYSAGVLLYRLLTTSYPVQANDLDGLRHAHARRERIALRVARRDVPLRLSRVIERAIAADPASRYPSADKMAADLAALHAIPRVLRPAYGATIAVALVAVGWLAWELRGRPLPGRTTSVPIAAGALVPLSEPPVIAVLPFKNLSSEPDSDYFVDGLTGEIIRNLAVIDGLQVKSQTSSFFFKGKPRNLVEIGKQLRANLVVEGSVQRDGRRLRINAQLVRVAGDVPLWSERFDRALAEVFDIQDEIARAIVNKLRLTLGRGQRRYETNVGAYELYLKARALVDRRGVDNAQNAAELFEQVIARDPAFAPAHAGLANAYAFMSLPYRGISFQVAYPIMRPAAGKAVELDPLLAEAHAAMGWVSAYEHDWEKAKKAFQHAIELNPSLTQTYTSYSISTLQPLGQFDEALRLLEVAARNDPLSLDVLREIGEVQFFAGRYGEAIDTFERIRAADPDFPFVGGFLARALTFAGRPAEALALVEKGHWSIARAYVMTGQRDEAKELARSHAGNPYAEAMTYAALADETRTLDAVERTAVSAPQRVGRLLLAPEMAAFRDRPPFLALRKKFNLP